MASDAVILIIYNINYNGAQRDIVGQKSIFVVVNVSYCILAVSIISDRRTRSSRVL